MTRLYAQQYRMGYKRPKDRRRRQRIGIEALNRMGEEELRKHPSLRDRKSWWEHPLDWIDLPRNLIGNIIGGLVGARPSDKKKGALGLPRIYMSDVLKKLGVRNRVVKAIGGFVGDVLIDPLTYASGGSSAFAKWGGHRVAKAGVGVVDDAVKAALKTGKIGTLAKVAGRPGKKIIRAFGLLKKASPKRAAQLRRAIAGQDRALTEGIKKGLIANVATKGAAGDLARSFFKQYGRKGLAVAHVPFTAKEVTLPIGRIARFQKAVARGEGALPAIEKAALELANVRPGAGFIGRTENIIRRALGGRKAIVRPEKTLAGRAGWWIRRRVPGEQTEIEGLVARWQSAAKGMSKQTAFEVTELFKGAVLHRAKKLGITSKKAVQQVGDIVRNMLDVGPDVLKQLKAQPAAKIFRVARVEGVPRIFEAADPGIRLLRQNLAQLDNQDIRGLVKILSGELDTLATAQSRRGIIGSIRSGYFPGVLTDEAREAATELAIRSGARPEKASAWADDIIRSLTTTDPAAKHRSMFIVEATEKFGVRRRINAWADPDTARKLLRDADRIDGGVRVVNLTRDRINELARQGELSWLFGKGFKGKAFIDDPAIAAAKRIERGWRSVHEYDMVRELSGVYGRMIPHKARHLLRKGWSVPHTKRGMFTNLKIPGQMGAVDVMMPDWIAKHVSTAVSYFEDPAKTGPLLRAYDKLMSLWKQQALVGASWPTVNFISNKLLMLQGGFKLKDIDAYPQVIRLLRVASRNINDPAAMRKALKGLTFRLGRNQTIGGDDLYRFLVNNRVLDHGFFGEMGAAMRQGIPEMFEAHLRKIGQMKPDRLRQLAGMPKAGWNKFFGWYFDINSRYIENADKAAMFLSRMKSGDTMEAAARTVKEFIFDYARGTAFERGTAQRMMPFWKWIKNNTYRQFRDLLERPRYAASLPKLVHAFDTAFLENQVPQELLPRWVQEGLGVQVSGDEEGGVILPLMTYTPYEELFETFANPIEKIALSLTPLAKMPMEQLFGRTLFGRALGRGPGELGIGGHLMAQLRSPKEAARIATMIRKGETTPAAIAKLLMGGRVQRVKTVREQARMARETRVQMMGIRRALNKAIEQGDTAGQGRWAAEARLLLEEQATLGLPTPKSIRKRLPLPSILPLEYR